MTLRNATVRLRPKVVMVRHTSFRFFRALRGLCSPRNFIVVTMVTVTLYLFPPPRWRDLRLVVLFTEKAVPTVSSMCGTNGSSCSSNSSSLPPSVLRNASFTLSPVQLTSTIKFVGGYLSQSAPMGGTGQGNLMFMYASLLGIADHAKMVPIYPDDGPLKKVFVITTKACNPSNSASVQEGKACAFDANLFNLANREKNRTVLGYLQSWKYFDDIKDRIRQEFTFKDKLRVQAFDFLSNISLYYRTNNNTLYIGVHIRRADMLVNYNVARGYTVASKEYLAVACNHFRKEFPASTLVFVVCTDDPDWSKQNFPMVDRNSFVAFSDSRRAAVDMAILASCNHTIITVGTYGWWSAYLAGGRTIYYKDFPAPGSHINGILTKEDYFPPHWIGF